MKMMTIGIIFGAKNRREVMSKMREITCEICGSRIFTVTDTEKDGIIKISCRICDKSFLVKNAEGVDLII